MRIGFDEIGKEIRARPCLHPVRLVGIDGFAGSGKSTFADRLRQSLDGAPVIPTDDFNALDDLEEYWPRFEEQILSPLFAGRTVRYQMRDWVNDYRGRGLGEWRVVPFSPIVILEGIGASRKELADRLSFAIWIEAPEELRLERGLLRDAAVPDSETIWRTFMPGERRYFERDGASERANLVVDGSVSYDADGRFLALSRRAV